MASSSESLRVSSVAGRSGDAAEEGIGGRGRVGRLGAETCAPAVARAAKEPARCPPEDDLVRSIHCPYSLR